MAAVLLVENFPELERGYRDLLEGMGLTVTSVLKIKELVPGTNKIIAMTPDHKGWVEVDLDAGFVVALLDFNLGDDSLKGDVIVSTLRELGTFCVGITASHGGQIKMLWLGANLAVLNKATVPQAFSGELKADGYRWPEDFDVEKNGPAVLEQLRTLLTATS